MIPETALRRMPRSLRLVPSVGLALSALVLIITLAATSAVRAQSCDYDELNSVYFDISAVALTPDAVERLEENVTFLSPCPNLGVLVEAVADEEEAMADALSTLRAETIARWYLAHGVSAARVAARGSGEDPYSSGIEDPGPGDSRARRADSTPMPVADLPADALDWADAERTDPEPFEQEIAEDVTLTLDWDLVDAATVALGAARLDAAGRTWALPVDGLRAAWPGSHLVRAAASEGAPGAFVIRGTLSPAGDPYAVTWLVGPTGARRIQADVCAEAEAYDAALGLDLRALADASRRGDAEAVARATEAAVVNGAGVRGYAATVDDVGGTTLVLDCSPLPLRHDH